LPRLVILRKIAANLLEGVCMSEPPRFDAVFQDDLLSLFRWRRDVRRFRPDSVAPQLVERLLDAACLAPSVGNSQPWRFVEVADADRRQAIRDNFADCNRAALEAQPEDRQGLYARLKLEGIEVAPVQFAVFCDENTAQGHGLGSRTMPETLRYSVVMAIHTLWLGARACDLGLGWVSILDPERLRAALAVPETWSFVAYLCIGYPLESQPLPELERLGWQARAGACREVLRR
jgi:5,6-dimethylbenzimidazole synthase